MVGGGVGPMGRGGRGWGRRGRSWLGVFFYVPREREERREGEGGGQVSHRASPTSLPANLHALTEAKLRAVCAAHNIARGCGIDARDQWNFANHVLGVGPLSSIFYFYGRVFLTSSFGVWPHPISRAGGTGGFNPTAFGPLAPKNSPRLIRCAAIQMPSEPFALPVCVSSSFALGIES